MRRFLSFGPAFVVLVTAAVTLLLVPGAIRNITAATTHANVLVAQQNLDGDDVLERLNKAIRNIATAVEPSVVHLEVYSSAGSARGMPVMHGSSGSGWIYDSAGHIITNAHVISDSDEVLVQFFDGHVTKGKVIQRDVLSDIAVLKVDGGEHLEPARRASGMKLDRGDRVFAFGSPFGFKFSMSEGIVSGLGRSARTMMGGGISNFIQTDAAVNPGNSGGPLVDVHGRVVGMNVAIATAQNASGANEGQSAGISFAIPLGTIESRVEQMIEGVPLTAGFLGVGAARFEDPTTVQERRGTRIGTVAPGQSADKAGVKPGDVILSLDDQATSEWAILQSLIKSAHPGQTVTLKVLRGDEELTLKATLSEMPTQTRITQNRQTLSLDFGMELQNTSDGPLAIVQHHSTATDQGLDRRQYITDVGGDAVNDTEDVLTKLQEHGFFAGRTVTIKTKPYKEKDDTSEDAGKPKSVDIKLVE